MADRDLIDAVRTALRRAAQPQLAGAMQAYMKSRTPFLGVRVPVMRALTRAEAARRPFTAVDELVGTVRALWDEAQFREERYAAIALLDTASARKLRTPELLELLHDLVVAGAWWDYVDELAHRVGDLLLRWPEQVRPTVLDWTTDGDHWLRRVSIICQLGARERTDRDLLTRAIEASAGEGDFFLRKAIGWALRDLAKHDPAWVRQFVDSHDLSPLSRREALKHLG